MYPVKKPIQRNQINLAAADIYNSFVNPRLWVNLAWRDINVQFERSFLGPLWMTLQAGSWVVAIVLVFGGIMGPYREYSVYVGIGIVLYNFITVMMTDSSDIFIRNRIIIHSHPIPYFSYILRQIMFGILQLGFQSLVVVVVFVVAQYPITPTAMLAIPGIILGIIMSICLAVVFSFMGIRFGDFRFAMLAFMRLGLFVTPILWTVKDGGSLKKVAALINPMSHFIDLVRMPLMGEIPPITSYVFVGSCIIFSAVLGGFLFVNLRRSISLWV